MEFIFGNKDISRSTSGSNYEELLRKFTKDFYSEFKEYIIKSRKEHNMDILFDVIGADNFRELNNLINEYKDYFAGMKIVGLHRKLLNKEVDSDVEYHNECIRKKDEILEKMRENKVKYEENNKIAK